MEPLSITVSIITLLNVASKITYACQYYLTLLRDPNGEPQSVLIEMESIRDVLERLKMMGEKSKNGDDLSQSRLPHLEQLCQPGKGPLDLCLRVLEKLDRKLALPRWSGKKGSKGSDFFRAVVWPMKEQETRKTLDTLARLRGTMNFSLTADMT